MRTMIIHYVRNKNFSVKFQLWNNGLFQYNEHECIPQNSTIPVYAGIVPRVVRHYYSKTTIP
jgi:hypothetical protein